MPSTPRRALLACTLLLTLTPRARAEVQVGLELGSAVNYAIAEPGNRHTSFANLRPGLTLVFGSPRLVWTAEYAFAGALTLKGTEPNSYNNAASLALAAQPGDRAMLTLTAAATQGSTLERTISTGADSVTPTLRAAEDPAQVTASAIENFSYELSPGLDLGQSLQVNLARPQHDPEFGSMTYQASLSATWSYPRDAFGVTVSPRYAKLHPIILAQPPLVEVVTGTAQLTWTRDLDPRWNASGAGGVEAMRLLTRPADGGERRIDVHPAGNAALRYTGGRLLGTLTYLHGAVAHLEEGTFALSDVVTLGGAWTLHEMPLRQVTGSVGFLSSRPLRRSAGVATVSGKSRTADVGIVWGLWGAWNVNARYSIAYQYDRSGDLGNATLHGFMVGLAWQSNPGLGGVGPVPTAGNRVDGGDAVQFPGTRSEPAP